ncbi:MAG TPA: CPBP family intramembrane glutamic endopeptidase, partial [Rhizomicrobium sp.]|nr:CPBP family intramembrane glutamic endopeptidase [Rhizomicrobium sp.]
MTDTAATPIKRSWRNNRLLRLLILFVTLMVIYAVAQELGERSLPKFAHLDAHMSLALGYGLGVAASLAAYVWLVHVLERRSPIGELAPRKAPGGLLAGFLLGVGIISAVIGVMWLMGAATLALNTPPLPSFAMVAVAIVSAVCEELIFRGALFRIPEEMFGTLVAIVISGLLFGGAHIVNPHANWASSTAIVIEAGPLFGLAYA